ncbi:tetratricopeptide repeat protein [Paludibaculum fermentans]|uniref:Tetratricopeptide repeat protein n=1 Tax=Paludibaculum fermentans TaxID=1473598 RepID=A0A7S7NWR9_PALFE|nr:tetratricopeptide repeat protein [Paludibaculum fermentans]QOY91185.1 tetratricopeptide repeat protein [Paludibaculum fermentans]
MTGGLALLLVAQAALWPEMDPLVQKGYDHFYNLEYPEAIATFQKAVEAAPLDPNRRNHLAQAVLFSLMFRAGALETEMVTGGNPFLRRPKMEPTPAEETLFENALNECSRLSQALLAENPDDTNALYAQGVALGLRGTYNYLVKKEWLDSLRDMTAGRKLHNRVYELDPTNIDALMMQGMHDYVVGSLPFAYKVLGFLAGFHGDRQQGIRTVQIVAEKGKYNRVDAEILLGIAARRERRPGDAVQICEKLRSEFPRNFLVLFELSQMYADLGDKDNAWSALDRVEELKKSNAPGFQSLPVERIEFARGNLLFWYDDPDAAIVHLRKATRRAQALDPNSGVTAWLRLGQCLDLKGRRAEARAAYRSAIQYWPASDEAKSARKYLDKVFTTNEKRAMSG